MTKHLCWNILDRRYSKKIIQKASYTHQIPTGCMSIANDQPIHTLLHLPTSYTKIGSGKPYYTTSSATAHKQIQQRKATTHIHKIIKPYILIQPTYRLHLLPPQIPPRHIQILLQPSLIITLRNNRHIPLRRPSQQHLRRRLAMFLRYLHDRGVLEE